MGARPRRRRRTASKLRRGRWLRRHGRLARGLLVAGVGIFALVVALIAPRLIEKSRDTGVTRGTPIVARGTDTPSRRVATPRLAPPQQHEKAQALPLSKMPFPVPSPGSSPAPPAVRSVADRSSGPRVAIVIDDLGQSLSQFEQLAGLNIPLSIAVIPGLPATARTVSEASRRGIETLLHQPMEPRDEGGKDPGAGVLLSSMTAAALRAQVRENLAAVPGAVGVNNHMGSRFTEDAAGLGALMAEIKDHNLFWLDSRTTAGTRGVEVAHAAGVPAIERDIFLDAEVNPDFIRRQVRKLIETARVRGTAIGIGHPHLETIAVLRELRTELLASGVTLVPVSTLARGSGETAPGTALAAALAGKTDAGEPATGRKTATP